MRRFRNWRSGTGCIRTRFMPGRSRFSTTPRACSREGRAVRAMARRSASVRRQMAPQEIAAESRGAPEGSVERQGVCPRVRSKSDGRTAWQGKVPTADGARNILQLSQDAFITAMDGKPRHEDRAGDRIAPTRPGRQVGGGGVVGLHPVAFHHHWAADEDFPDRAARRFAACATAGCAPATPPIWTRTAMSSFLTG